MAAIPSDFRKKARDSEILSQELLSNSTISLSSERSESTSIDLAEMRCKHYYKILNKNSTVEPTSIKTWKINFADAFTEWQTKFSYIYQSTRDNKWRQFSFRLLHRILTTKKELFKYRIASDETCIFCPNSDSIEHAFIEWSFIVVQPCK